MARTPASDPFERLHEIVVLTHHVLRRGCRQMVDNASTVKDADVQPFVGYSLAFLTTLKEHHDQEETVLFPTLHDSVQVGIDARHEEHVQLAKFMGDFKDYLESVRDGQKTYAASEYLAQLQPVKDLVLPHVTAEEGDLEPENLRKLKVSEETMVKLLADMAAAGKASDRTVVLAFTIMHLTQDEKTLFWGKVPFVIRDYVFPLYTWWNSSFWKFASSSSL
ncbi:hypothetical protein BJ742DRAFT_802284 [Cladochytrium replicatum]|nr:hypothetical protein BJ742DRAFT_802284 [Cladochytrium replicatum]